MMMDAESDGVPPPEQDRMVNDATDNESPPPRLMITKMVLENFKSYAGIKEIGPFHKCFSAVVGPNGSGKSNVIDAMLFVFGKRAKKLRLNKVSELIHKSDAVKNDPPQYARVSVYFQEILDTGDGDDDYEVVPNTQAVITRVAQKNNSSTYKLNGKNSSFKEIAVFLNSKGIDLDNNRFLILQGEVELISMMAPKGKTENDEGLLEYLEDIIGSSKFVEDTNLAYQKVEALTDARQEKLNRVKAVEKEKDNLEGAKQEAEALLGKEREIRRKQNLLYQIHGMRAHQEAESVTEKKDKVTQKLEEEREQLVKANARIEEIESGLSEQRKEYNAVFAELKRTKEEFAAYERKDIKLREEIKHARTQKKKLADKIKAEAKKETTAINKGEKATESIPQLEEKIVELTELKAEEDAKLEQIYEEMKGVTQKLRVELESKAQELAPVKQERAVFQAALGTAETELKLLEDAVTRATERLQASEEELEALDETQETKRQTLTQHQEGLKMTKGRIVAAEKEEQELAQRESMLSKKNKEYLARAEDAKQSLQSTGRGARSKAVEGILNAARKGGELSKVGVLGRFGDLATIPEKYDVAVSTACGMLDHIVVQTTAGAQRCLEFLRKHNLGRVSFIPLDKMKKGAHDRVVETPEGAARLFDLITPSNFAFTPAIFLAVGNTLVAPDLETATRWAYDFSKRWRVVTLDGKLIETAGTMAGGGKNVRRGGMRLANGRSGAAPIPMGDDGTEECERLEQEAQKAHELLQECRARRRQLLDEIKSLKKTVKSLEVQLPKLQMEITGCDTTREELTKLIPQLRTQCQFSAEDAAKKTGLEKNVQKCKSDMASCAELAAKLEKEVARLQKAILEAGGSRLKKQKAACEQALSDLNATEKALRSAKVEVGSTEKAAAKANAAKAAFEAELAQCEEMLTEKETEFQSLEVGAMEVMQAFEQVKGVEAEKRVSLEGASKESEELKKSQSEIKCIEIDLLGKIEAYEKQISELKRKVHHWEKEISRLQVVEDECEFDDDEDDESVNDADETENEDGESEPSSENGDVEMEDAEEAAPADNSENMPPATEPKRSSLPKLSHATLDKYDTEEIKDAIGVLETERNTLAKNANMGAIAEYRKKEGDYLSRVTELDEVSEERNVARKAHEELRRQRLEMFLDGFGSITLKLKEMYQMITLGGDAELELVDSLDPFSEGIVFSVRPPKKSWKNISNLSGGEKTLSSLALVFALHHYKPTPLYVMDEIDAALDFKNVSIVANYIKERTKNAQFIIISLRNNMFELADRLVGIYKTENCTKSVTINPRAFGAAGQQNGALPLKDRSNKERVSMQDAAGSGKVSLLAESNSSMVL